ncbi:MAG TPA: glycosyltransferase family 4 protein [Longimicrobium sp.]
MPRPLHTLARAVALLAALPFLAANALLSAALSRAAAPSRREPCAPDALQVVVPYEPGQKSGGARAIQGLLRALETRCEVVALPLYGVAPQGGQVARLAARWLTYALPMPCHCRPFAVSGRSVRRRIARGRPLVIEFMSGAMFLLLGPRPENCTILREHEPLCRRLWSERRMARGAERVLLPVQAAAAWLAMTAVYLRVDRIVALTPQDAAFVRRAFPFVARRVVHVPVSIDPPGTRRARVRPAAREVLMLANFYHRPNVDGLVWWLREVAPRLGEGWTLHLCGLDEPLHAVELPRSPVRIVRHGFVEDLDAAFPHVLLALAPVISGGGVRMKNLELAARGKAVVTTTRGNEGIGFLPDVEAVVVDEPADMARALRALADDPAAARAMGERARTRVWAGFGHAAVLERWCRVFAELDEGGDGRTSSPEQRRALTGGGGAGPRRAHPASA